MRSIEFLREAESPEAIKASLSPAQLKWLGGADPTDPNIMKRLKNAVPDTAPAAAAPAAAAPAASTPIDPIVRQRLGLPPATQKEIADYQAANPGYGKVVDSSGRPITTGSGGPVAAGGEQSVIKAAQTAAPALPTGTIDPNAGELGNQTPGGGGFNRNAGELGNQDPSLDTIRKNAGLVGTQNQAPDAAAPAALPTGNIDPNAGELGNQTPSTRMPPAVAAPVAPPTTLEPAPLPAAPTGTVDPNAGELGNQTPSTRIPSDEKYPRSAAPTAAPTAPATAQEIANLNGIANINKIRAGQILKMPNGSTYTVKPGDTLGKIAAMPAQGATPVPKTAPRVSPTPVPVPPMPNPNFRTGTMAQRDAWLAKYGKTHNMDGKPAQGATPNLSLINQGRSASLKPGPGNSPMRESKFDESVNLMRRLSNMLKG